jgi:hypothetical protein
VNLLGENDTLVHQLSSRMLTNLHCFDMDVQIFRLVSRSRDGHLARSFSAYKLVLSPLGIEIEKESGVSPLRRLYGGCIAPKSPRVSLLGAPHQRAYKANLRLIDRVSIPIRLAIYESVIRQLDESASVVNGDLDGL